MSKKKKDMQNTNAPEQSVPQAAGTPSDHMSRYAVKTDSKRINKREALIRLLAIVLAILLLLLLGLFACSQVLNNAGDFTVTMDKDGTNAGLSLSETKNFKDPTRFLTGTKCENMRDCTLSWLPDNVDDIDGSHNRSNGQDFMAYTFYVKNIGTKQAGYYSCININSVALGADEALRVMVYINGKSTIYAKPQVGTTDVLEKSFVDYNFVSSTKVMQTTNKKFKAGDIDKYTVVIWLEGEDPECVDDILEGEVKLSMDFELIDT